MQRWGEIAGRLRTVRNFIIIYVCRFIPWLSVKSFLYRLTGMKVGRNVSVGLMAMFDIFFPHLISIGDNTVIGYNATVLAHEFLVSEYRIGRVDIGRDVLIGANATVLAGVSIGDRAMVAASSLVNKDVPSGVLAIGVPVQFKRAAYHGESPEAEVGAEGGFCR